METAQVVRSIVLASAFCSLTVSPETHNSCRVSQEIEQACAVLGTDPRFREARNVEVLPLYSALPPEVRAHGLAACCCRGILLLLFFSSINRVLY